MEDPLEPAPQVPESLPQPAALAAPERSSLDQEQFTVNNTGALHSVSFTPDGRLLAAGPVRRAAPRGAHLPGRRPRPAPSQPQTLAGPAGQVSHCYRGLLPSCSPEGRRWAAAGREKGGISRAALPPPGEQ